MSNFSFRKVALAAGAVLALSVIPASAQDLSENITCLHGSVAYGDYHEYDHYMSEKSTDRKAGVSIIADGPGLVINVLDYLTNSVCEEEANNRARCTFRLDRTANDNFTIRIDNLDAAGPKSYKVCAF